MKENAAEILYRCHADDSMQPAVCRIDQRSGPRPLLVALHTWSFGHSHKSFMNYFEICEKYGWHMIHPEFRGPNDSPDGCGSEKALRDIADAVAYMKAAADVDESRVYLAGGSGGGHCALLMAGRYPELWTAVSAWCPITDLSVWYGESLQRGNAYAGHIASACGGDPRISDSARAEAAERSPVTWIRRAAKVPVDISTGIHDGHTGSVPIGHAVRAYNALAAEPDRISAEDIDFMERCEQIPRRLAVEEPGSYTGGRKILLRRRSQRVRLTIFEGGHNILYGAAAEWLARQQSGRDPDWSDSGSAGSCDASGAVLSG